MHGSHRLLAPASGVLFAVLAGLATAAPPPVADFVRWPAYDTLAMSPDGKYLAATVPLEDGRAGVVLRREDLSISTTIKDGPDAYLDALYWANSRRLFMHFTRPMEFSAGRGWLPEIYAIDADGGNKGTMYGYIADLLPEDEDHDLLQVCDRYGCEQQAVYKADVKRLRNTVFADRHGDVRVASSAEKQGFQVLHVRADAESEWRVLHEEAKVGIRIDPLRISPDGSLYAQGIRSGPDRIDRIDKSPGRIGSCTVDARLRAARRGRPMVPPSRAGSAAAARRDRDATQPAQHDRPPAARSATGLTSGCGCSGRRSRISSMRGAGQCTITTPNTGPSAHSDRRRKLRLDRGRLCLF
ncbi:MAG: hypothetical protein ACK59M_04670 [Pseudomonadota bacterium]|jgi:hypothetical protein